MNTMILPTAVTSPLRRDIDRQPDVLAALWRRADDFRAVARHHLKTGPGGRLFVCGCGDGLFAAQAAVAYAEAQDLDWRAIGALDLVLSAARLRPTDRIIAISMSGNVDRTVEAAQAVERQGVPLVALVNGGGGRLGAVASAKISLDIEDIAPFLCGTASYTATVLALILLAQGAADVTADLAIAAVGRAQQAALSAADAVVPRLPEPTGVRLLSAGAQRGTVRYGAAKFVELTRTPAWSTDLEEFAHSHYWAMPVSDLVVMIAADPTLARYADDNCDALRELGVTTLAIDTAATPVPRATHRITIPSVEATLMALVTPLPLQLLSAGLARAAGLDPDTRLHLKNDETRFRVSRLLTRRPLLGTGQ
jgi:fructoselysine-6-P-deglycase FrlB-like protein